MSRLQRLLLSAVLFLLAFGTVLMLLPENMTEPEASAPPTLLLIPVDSRPVNTQHVELLARMAGYNTLVPPQDLLDNYTQPADKEGLLRWLQDNFHQADQVIIASSSIVAGGLIASRHPASYSDWEQQMDRFKGILQSEPDKTVVVLSVMPRLLPTQFDNPGWKYRQQLSRLAQLTDKSERGKATEAEQDELSAIEQSLPHDTLNAYLNVFEYDYAINQSLLGLAQDGLVDQLVLTLDDASIYGLSNLNQRKLVEQAARMDSTERVSALTGADETTMLILARLINQVNGHRPVFGLHYETPADANLVLRYESASLGRCIEEKVAFVGGAVSEQAYNNLFVHARPGMTRVEQTASMVRECSGQVGIIDVAYINKADSDFMDALFAQAGTNAIHSYAGWNTASNSVGSVIAHLSVRDAVLSVQHPLTPERLQSLAQADLEYRFLHIADEVVYLAQVKTALSSWVKQQGISEYQIPSTKRSLVNEQLRQLMRAPLENWAERFTGQFLYIVQEEPIEVTVTNWQWEVELPWPRLFEVHVSPKPVIP